MKPEVKNILRYSISAIILFAAIAFSMKKQSEKYVSDLKIEIIEEAGNYFLDQAEVLELLNASQTDYVLSLPKNELELKNLEQRLEEHSFISDAQIFLDVKGNMNISVEQARPVARIIFEDGSGKYINDDGSILPLNAKHTARVLLIELQDSEKWASSMYDHEQGSELMELIFYINNDDFWKAQIAQVVVDKEGDVVMLPQVTKQEIRFGKVEDIEEKFKKLKIFYTEILPYKGWNTYAFVDLKFNNQIVCE